MQLTLAFKNIYIYINITNNGNNNPFNADLILRKLIDDLR